MSTDLDLATLDHWFGWMRNSESWRREREIVYSMWAEIERLREAYKTDLAETLAEKVKLEAEIERLRKELERMVRRASGIHGIN